MKPVYTEDGITYMYIKVRIAALMVKVTWALLSESDDQHNNLFLLAVTKKNANVALVLTFFEKLVTVRM